MRYVFSFCILLISFQVFAQTPIWTQKANPQNLAINGVAFRADGQKVICGTNCHPATIRMYDVGSSNLDWNYEVPSAYLCIMGVGISSNSNYIISIEEFGNLFVFDNTGSQPVFIDSIKTGTPYAFSNEISPDDQLVAVGCSNGKLKVYRLNGGQLVHDINAHINWVSSVAYAPNGDKMVTGGNDRLVKIWDSAGTLLHTCTGHADEVKQVKVTSDNQFVLSASKDKTIKVWDLNTGALLRTITGHTASVNGIAISPDSKKVVSASQDGSCKIWEIGNGHLLKTFGVIDSGAINTVSWSPLGDKIVTGNARSDLSVWGVSSALSVSDQSNQGFDIKVLPNPVRNTLYIELQDINRFMKMGIYTMNGAQVYRSERNEPHDLSHLPAGLYYVEVEFKNSTKAFKKFQKL